MELKLLLIGSAILVYIIIVALFVYPKSKAKHGDDWFSIVKEIGLALVPLPLIVLLGSFIFKKALPRTEFEKKVVPPTPVKPEEIKQLEQETVKTNENIQQIIENIESTVRDAGTTEHNPDFEERLRRKSRDS